MKEEFSAMILDDEADYASQKRAWASPIPFTKNWTVRETIPRNCYVAYTHTAGVFECQPSGFGGLSEDFFWLLEPYAEEMNGEMV